MRLASGCTSSMPAGNPRRLVDTREKAMMQPDPPREAPTELSQGKEFFDSDERIGLGEFSQNEPLSNTTGSDVSGRQATGSPQWDMSVYVLCRNLDSGDLGVGVGGVGLTQPEKKVPALAKTLLVVARLEVAHVPVAIIPFER